MRWTLSVKLALGIAIIMFVTMGASLLLLNILTRDRMMEDFSHSAIHLSDMAVAGLENSMISRNQEEMENIMQTISRDDEIEGGVIFDNRGEIKYSSDPKDMGRILSKNDPACRLCHDITSIKDKPQTIILPSKQGEHMLRVARPIYNQPRCQRCHREKKLGMLVIDFSLANIERNIRVVISKQVHSTLIVAAIIIASLIGFVFLMVTRPLEHFVRIIRAINMGDLNRRVKMTRHDEIGELAASFDNMVGSMATRTQELEKLNEIAATQITERKRTEERLFYILKAVESTSNAIGISDPQGHHFYQNRALSDLFGYATAEELEAAGGGAAVVKDPKIAKEMFDSIMSGNSWVGELEMVTKSGRVFPAFERADAIKDNEGRMIGLMGIITDITERKKADEDLKIFKESVDNSSDAIGLSTPEGRHYYQNKAFDQMFGTIGATPQAVYADQNISKEVFSTIMSGRQWTGEVKMYANDGSVRDVFLRAYANKDAHGNITALVGIHSDITDRKRSEEEKEKLQNQLNQSQRIDAIGQLAGGVAHDFNNMLGVILGHTELALDSVNQSDPLNTHLAEIRKAAQRSSELTSQLLAFARKQTMTPKVLYLNDTIDGMLRMLRRLIGEDIDLNWLPNSALWPVKADPSQIDQILANLCVNARDAIAGVGEVTIETRNTSFDEAYCADHAGYVPGDYVQLCVSDNGCGMGREVLDKLFEPFFTTKETGKGTGLGLATVYGIIKQNNGYINVYSKSDQGTTFKIYLPRYIGDTETARTEIVQESEMRGQETILLVEDEPSLLELNTLILESQGYRVLAAGTPREAIRLVEEHKGTIHLLMTDVVMPEMNGRDLAKNLLTLNPQLKCLFTSGYTADVIAHHGVLDEGVFFIQKPFSRKDLAAKVREVLEQK